MDIGKQTSLDADTAVAEQEERSEIPKLPHARETTTLSFLWLQVWGVQALARYSALLPDCFKTWPEDTRAKAKQRSYLNNR